MVAKALLHLESKFPFGEHKGLSVEWLILHRPVELSSMLQHSFLFQLDKYAAGALKEAIADKQIEEFTDYELPFEFNNVLNDGGVK